MKTGAFAEMIERRINIITDAIRDGCLDCGEGLCRTHLAVVQKLTLNPREEVPRLERDIFGESR